MFCLCSYQLTFSVYLDSRLLRGFLDTFGKGWLVGTLTRTAIPRRNTWSPCLTGLYSQGVACLGVPALRGYTNGRLGSLDLEFLPHGVPLLPVMERSGFFRYSSPYPQFWRRKGELQPPGVCEHRGNAGFKPDGWWGFEDRLSEAGSCVLFPAAYLLCSVVIASGWVAAFQSPRFYSGCWADYLAYSQAVSSVSDWWIGITCYRGPMRKLPRAGGLFKRHYSTSWPLPAVTFLFGGAFAGSSLCY